MLEKTKDKRTHECQTPRREKWRNSIFRELAEESLDDFSRRKLGMFYDLRVAANSIQDFFRQPSLTSILVCLIWSALISLS